MPLLVSFPQQKKTNSLAQLEILYALENSGPYYGGHLALERFMIMTDRQTDRMHA